MHVMMNLRIYNREYVRYPANLYYFRFQDFTNISSILYEISASCRPLDGIWKDTMVYGVFPLIGIRLNGTNSQSRLHSPIHSPVHSPVHGPESSFYINLKCSVYSYKLWKARDYNKIIFTYVLNARLHNQWFTVTFLLYINLGAVVFLLVSWTPWCGSLCNILVLYYY